VRFLCVEAVVVVAQASYPARAEETAGDDVVLRAMVDELGRSIKELVLSDLPRPYFVQLNGNERLTYSMSAAYGGLQRSNENRSRSMGVRVRVGSYELDNTNFRRAFGGAGNLALDDDYTALRHTIWLLMDSDYKQAVETLAQKIAYLKDKTIEDRPDDFSPAPAVTALEPPGRIDFDRAAWEKSLQHLSDRFRSYPKIQDSDVTLFAGTVTEWIVNSEGTRLRTGDSGIHLQMDAHLQAEDGMPLDDALTYIGERPDQLPPIDKILSDIDEMCERLVASAAAPVLEHYTGPVLFDARAAGTAFDALLGDRLCARPSPLGSGGEDESFEKKIGLRILPRSFQVYDDPGPQFYEGTICAGSYRYDDEAVKPSKVQIVDKGILKTLLAGRAPTRKIKQTTGHGRSMGFGDPRANIGCLYISDDNGVPTEELKAELIQAARDEGLAYGLRIAALDEGSGGELGNPIYAYKVYVEDGREELVRGLSFRPIEPSAMKRILAAGKERKVHNSVSGLTASVIAPAVVFEELELTKLDEEFDTLPILQAPALRGK
jgi:predicted Zn-dependent protease